MEPLTEVLSQGRGSEEADTPAYVVMSDSPEAT